jgi:23S rRNA (cytidine1920-2'-O)/16S rRNA (cytidine1409-2'-O)-methyltransferase
MAKRSKDRSGRYVSRGGDKLERALDGFGLRPDGLTAADLGANVGGFTDCLLQHGVSRVYAVETGYGVLEWKLRQDERVVVMERTNALHVTLPEAVDLVVADVGWTSLLKVVPGALGLLKDGGQAVVLLKPQYEVDKSTLVDGHVDERQALEVLERVASQLSDMGCRVIDRLEPGLESRGRNPEWFLHVEPTSAKGL